jgi:hypothetical protein
MFLVVPTLMPLQASLVGDRVGIAVLSAVAGPSEKARSARVHLETGNAYFNLEKYKEAIGEFEQSYLDKQDPATFFNIGECHRLLGNNAEAIRFLRRFLQESTNHRRRPPARRPRPRPRRGRFRSSRPRSAERFHLLGRPPRLRLPVHQRRGPPKDRRRPFSRLPVSPRPPQRPSRPCWVPMRLGSRRRPRPFRHRLRSTRSGGSGR